MNFANNLQQIAHLKAQQMSAARTIQAAALELDHLKREADPQRAAEAAKHIATLHAVAHLLAGNRAIELYASEDERLALDQSIDLALAAGCAYCSGEVNAGPGWAAIQNGVAA